MEEPDETFPAALAGAGPREWAIDVLDDITDGRRPLLATRHPLGFVCIPVYRSDTDGVCLHAWSEHLAASRPTTSVMHAHSWDLDSYVLYGQVHNELIYLDDASDGATHRVFEVHSVGDVDEVRRTGRLVRYTGRTAERHEIGASYRLPAGVFHATTVVAEAATVAMGATRPEGTDLSLGAIDTPDHDVPRQRCSKDETLRAARTIRQHLCGSDADNREDG